MADESIYVSGAYIDSNPNYHVEDSSWKASKILDILKKNKLDNQMGSICEIGCGVGEILVQLQKGLSSSISIEGYEISPQAYQLSLSRQNENLKFYCEDLLLLDNHYDLMLCIDVIEHVDDYLDFVRKLRDKAKYTLFHIPLDLSVQTVLRSTPIQYVREKVGHIHYFTKDIAIAALLDSGYEIVDYQYTAGQLEISKSSLSKWLFWPRKLITSINEDFGVRLLGGYSLLILTKPRGQQ
ncbi:MAG: class I SAM-dependent methyltransferase [Chloroflexota bacterium]